MKAPNRVVTNKLISGTVVLLCAACSGATPAPEPHPQAASVSCPSGQKFDGVYCVPDPSAPTNPEAAPASSAPPAGTAAPAGSASNSETEPSPSAATSAAPATSGAPVGSPPPGSATPVDVSMAIGAAPLISYLASAHLPTGAKPFGAPFAGQFLEGQIFEQRVKLNPGKCYTIVAAALPPVQSISLEMKAVSDGASLLKEDEAGTQAVIGRKKECFVATEANTDVRLVVRVEKGQGVAAGQVFEK